MAKRKHVADFFATNKDIYDLLASAKRRMNRDRLLEIARRRGIYLSRFDDREALAQYISRLDYDWNQLSTMLDLTETRPRPERITNTEIGAKADTNRVRGLLEAVKSDRAAKSDEVYQIRSLPGGKIAVDVQYTEFDPSKATLSQRQTRNLTIEVESAGDTLRVRHQATDRAQSIVDDFARKLSTEEKAVDTKILRLRSLVDAQARTRFFNELMRDMKGFSLEDVTAVHVARTPGVHAAPLLDSSDEQDEDNEDNVLKAEFVGVVRTAVLRGESLLKSQLYTSLSAKGYYIARCVWQSREKSSYKLKAEFEAGFVSEGENDDDADVAEDDARLWYNVRGVFEKKQPTGEDRKTKTVVKGAERDRYLQILEETARIAFDAALAPGE